MSGSRAKAGLALCSVALIALIALLDMRRSAPGPLTSVHAGLPALSGGNDCASCHGGLFSDMSSSCLECHELIAGHLRDSRGLHGSFDRSEAVRCASCHSEHHGPDFAMVNPLSFARADVPERLEFDHVRVGFLMDGRHLEQACDACHEHAEAAPLLEGQQRYVGLESDCASCHEDPHDGRMALDCTSCHGQQAFGELASRGHERQLALDGVHGQLDCRACHAADSQHALEALGPAGGARAPRDCASCHESPHDAGFVDAAARLSRVAPGVSCRVCHTDEQRVFSDAADALNPVQHGFSGFALEGPHAAVGCDECHEPGRGFARRYPGRGPDDCASCHADPHGGQFDGSPLAPDGCVDCHAREHFEPHAFGAELHGRTALPLDGRHAESECAACHERADDDAPRRFAGTPARCEACHEDAHAAAFAPHAETLDAEPAGSCAVCHGTRAFSLLPAGFDHGRWTSFPVEAAHAQAECVSCHPRSAEPDALGRRFGRVPEHDGVTGACADCHADPHGGAFDSAWRPAQVDGRTGCARCHEQSSFRAFPGGFDHRLWTGFGLQGAHDRLDCTACHAVLSERLDAGRSLAPALGARCADCHADPHAGQFRQADGVDCARCHRDAGSFAELRFDHERDARFGLGEAHGELACGACHESVDVGGTPVVRYRPLVTSCVDCHGEPEDVLLRRPGARR